MNRYAFMTYPQYCKAIENMTDASKLSEIRHQACKDNSHRDSLLHATSYSTEISRLFLAMNSIRDRIETKEK